LVSLFEVITFFGVSAFFAWLGLLPLLNDLLPPEDDLSLDRARENLIAISDYYLVSFMSFATAIVADYVFHNGIPFFFPYFYHLPILYFVIPVVFAVGIFTLLLPVYYIRSIWKGKRTLAGMNPTVVSGALLTLYFMSIMLFLAWIGYINSTSSFRNIMWAGVGFMSVLGILLPLKYKVRTRFKRGIVQVLALAPVLLILLNWIWDIIRVHLSP
jgi:hypothetical protein